MRNMILSPFQTLLRPKRSPSPIIDPRQRIIVPRRYPTRNVNINTSEYGTLQRKSDGTASRLPTGVYVKGDFSPNSPCCCSGSSVAGTCPCSSGSGQGVNSSWKVTLANWTACNLNTCGCANQNIGCPNISWSMSATNINGTFCCPQISSANPRFISPSCVFFTYVPTGVSGTFYPDATYANNQAVSPCSGRTFTVTGFFIYMEATTAFNDYSGSTPAAWISVIASVKSDGTTPTTASDLFLPTTSNLDMLPNIYPVVTWPFGECGATLSWPTPSHTCADFTPKPTNINGSVTATDTAC